MTRAIETLISAWIAEQERERVRRSRGPEGVPSAQIEPERDAVLRQEPGAPPDR
jgi:hypothetical protein